MQICMASPQRRDGRQCRYLIWQDPQVKAALDPCGLDEISAALLPAVTQGSVPFVQALTAKFWGLGSTDGTLGEIREAAVAAGKRHFLQYLCKEDVKDGL
jgi:hypothetical protein